MAIEGESAKGIFGGSSPKYGGRRWNWAKRNQSALDRFAEALSKHVDQDDLDEGRVEPGTALDPGGNPREAAKQIGLKPESGNGMLQRLRQRLGPQAR